MIGYKAFDENLQCRGFQFEVGKTYDTGRVKEELKLCSHTVFHFCRELHKIESVSDYRLSKSRVCEVIADGDIVTDGDIYGTNKLTILREILREELNEYNRFNSGICNSGRCNSGSWNSGNLNSGFFNVGNSNVGNRNVGFFNVGNRNVGNSNVGNLNSGNFNVGNRNVGFFNVGDWNSGFFNTDSPLVRIFNKETNVPRKDIDFPNFLYFNLTVWTSHDTATDEEKEAHKIDIETCGGFLKTLSYKEAFRIAWNKAGKEEHKKLLKLPNWNNEIFMEISGIDAEAEIAKEGE